MPYSGDPGFNHRAIPATGILLTNLGTPAQPTPAALRRYLAEFLSDPRVIEIPALLWRPFLHGVLLRLRPRHSAAAYRRIWTDAGSPLKVYSRRLVEAIATRLPERVPGPVHLELAMRYGEPSVATSLRRLRHAGMQRLLVLPLYPQYSATTTASVFDAVSKELRHWRWLPELRMVRNYHDHPGYLQAVAQSVRDHRAVHGHPEKLLISFHGLPRHYFLAGDPYYCECHKSARLLAALLELPEQSWELVFQSRFGPRPWLKPYIDQRLQELAAQGIRHLQVVCPGFAVDCLETLEEIAMRGRDSFLRAGGRKFSYVPALNDSGAQVEFMLRLITEHCGGWPEFRSSSAPERLQRECEERARRAEQAEQAEQRAE